MADVIIRVSTDDQTNFDAIQRELTQTGTQAERAFQSIETAQNEARRESLRLREEYNRLGAQIAENNRIAASGDAATRTRIRTSNQRLQAERGLIAVEQRRNSLTLQNLTQERRELQAVTRASNQLANSKDRTIRSANRFGVSLGNIAEIVAGFGITELGYRIVEFGRNSVEAAARLEGFERGLRLIEGTNAPQRLEELIRVANLPGLNLTDLINYSNRLRAIGLSAEETDTILQSVGQTIVAFGGTADTAREAVEQITQALSNNNVSLQDFRSIAQRIPAFYQQIAEVHGVAANIDGFRVAVDRAGGSVKDALIPVLQSLAQEFGNTPADSYIVSLDGLQNSFFLLQAEIGERFLPIIAEGARALTTFFDAIRTEDLSALPEPIQAVITAAQGLWQQFQNIVNIIGDAVSPELSELGAALAPLLASILDLVSAVGEALSPAFNLLAQASRVVIALVVQLADTLTGIISTVTDFVDWISFWTDEEEALNETTKTVTASVQGLTAATNEATGATNQASTATQASTTSVEALVEATNRASTASQQRAQATRDATTAEMSAVTAGQSQSTQLTTLQGALLQVNSELATKRERYQDLVNRGVNPSHAAMQQLQRQIGTLETSSQTLSTQVNTLRDSIVSVEMPTTNANTATRVLMQTLDATDGVVAAIDTRFLSFRERGIALRDTLSEIGPQVRGVRIEIQNLSPFTAQITEQFQNIEISLADTSAEMTALNQVSREMRTELTSMAADQAIANAEINLVNPAVTSAVESMRTYTGQLGDVEGGLVDVETISENVRASIDRQTSSFDAFREGADDAATSLDALDTTMEAIDTQSADRAANIRTIGTEFSGLLGAIDSAIGSIPNFFRELAAGEGIVDAFSNLGTNAGNAMIGSLSNTLSEQLSDAVIGQLGGISLEGIGGISGLAGALAAPVGIFAGAVAAFAAGGELWVRAFGGETRAEEITPARVLLAGGQVDAEELGVGLDLAGLGEGVPDADAVRQAILDSRVDAGTPIDNVDDIVNAILTSDEPLDIDALLRGEIPTPTALGPSPDYTGSIAEPLAEPVAGVVSEIGEGVTTVVESAIETTQNVADERQSERDDLTDTRLEAREETQDIRLEAREESQDTRLTERINLDVAHYATLYANQIIHAETLEALQDEALEQRLNTHETRLTQIYDTIAARVASEIGALQAARAEIAAIAASGQADSTVIETTSALQAAATPDSGLGGGGGGGTENGANVAGSGETININIQNEIPLSATDVVRSVTSRQVQLNTQGVVNTPQ